MSIIKSTLNQAIELSNMSINAGSSDPSGLKNQPMQKIRGSSCTRESLHPDKSPQPRRRAMPRSPAADSTVASDARRHSIVLRVQDASEPTSAEPRVRAPANMPPATPICRSPSTEPLIVTTKARMERLSPGMRTQQSTTGKMSNLRQPYPSEDPRYRPGQSPITRR